MRAPAQPGVPAPGGPIAPTDVGGRRIAFVMLSVVATFLTIEVVLVAMRLKGHFSYTLDDPYIHLALAEGIAHAHYGLDPAFPAAPSSSILFPVLLAALSFTGVGQFAPLVLNVVATLASGLMLAALIGDVLPTGRAGFGSLLALAAMFVLGLNLIGLAMTGMEHSLHVALTLAWVLGALRFLRDGSPARWWWLCALAEPLVRFEGATLWLATVVLLLYHRRYRAGLALVVTGVVLLGGFSLFLHAQGLPLLPSSVLVKSDATANGLPMPVFGPGGHLAYTVATNLAARDAPTFLVSVLLLGLLVERKRRSADPRERWVLPLVAVALMVSLAHLALGRFDGFARYEVYALALNVAVLTIGFGRDIPVLARRAGPIGRIGIAAALMLFLGDYAKHSLRSDLAAADIYDQQFQMHRMAADFYRGAVAVNDLGWVSYRNPYPVLDLWGLGSEEARLARRADPTGGWMDDLARKRHVGLAMIYERWFPRRPTGWIALARLSLRDRAVSVGDPDVTFYATAPQYVAPIRTALDGLAASLPAGAVLDRFAVGQVVAGAQCADGNHQPQTIADRP